MVACGLAAGAVAALLGGGGGEGPPPNPAAVAALASSVSSHSLAAPPASIAGTPSPRQPPLWMKLGGTGFVIVVVPMYWRHDGTRNFLWFSDLALCALCAALWFDSALLVGMAAIGVLALEIAWSIDFLCGGRPLHLAGYMFEAGKPLYLRALSLFHLAMPPAILSMLRH